MKDLTPDEDAVLLGLLREIIVADGEYSEAERMEIDALKELVSGPPVVPHQAHPSTSKPGRCSPEQAVHRNEDMGNPLRRLRTLLTKFEGYTMFEKIMRLRIHCILVFTVVGSFLAACGSDNCVGGRVCECDNGTCSETCDTGSCSFTCLEGTSCRHDCAGGGCTLDCIDAESCQMSCSGGGCTLNCSGTAECVLTECTTGCSLNCGGASVCESSCDPLSGGCSVAP